MSHHATLVDCETICLRAGQGTGDGDPLVCPIAQTTTFCRDRVGSDPPHQYSRVSNPTVAALETALGDLEGALPASCFGTGLAAECALFLAVLRAGDHVVCGRSVYGGTTRCLRQLLPGLGVATTFVDATDAGAVRAAIRESTRLVFVETPANPALEIMDIRAVAGAAHEAGAILAVDNTFLTPVFQRPLDLGADVSVYSTTKFIEGHSVALGGSLVTRDGTLDERIRFIRKCTGAIQSPLNAWLTLNGLRTLPLRIRAQSHSAQIVARWLAARPEVVAVHHPSLATGAAREIAAAQHRGGHGAVVSFEVRGGVERARAFVEACRLCTLVEHVGSVQSLITHPATMTHADVPRAQRLEAGVTDGLLRLSVGLEPVDAITRDLERAIEGASVAARTNVAAQAKEVRGCHASL